MHSDSQAHTYMLNNPARVIAALAAALVIAIVLQILPLQGMGSSYAYGLTVESLTARPNQQGGNGIVGGAPTRLTWEATLGQDEDVNSLTFTLPEGTQTKDAIVKATVLDGLKRIETQMTPDVAADHITLNFATPLQPGSLLRVQIENVSLPETGGALGLSGSYAAASAGTKTFDASPTIDVIGVTPVDKIVTYLDGQGWVEKWNSNKFLNMFLKPQLVVTAAVSLFQGWLKALALVVLGFPLAIPIALIFAFMKMGKNKIGKFLSAIYINVIRGTPLFLQVYIAFFGLPLLGINIDNYILGVSVLALNSSAYLAEIFRAGIQSIPKGQFEAAASLGMTRPQTMFFVIIPQTFRRVIPTMTSEFILLYKDTSLLSSVGVLELMMFSKSLTATTGNITPYVVAAGYYLIVTLPLIKLVSLLEHKLAQNEAGKNNDKQKEDQAPSADPFNRELNASVHGSM